MRPILLALGLVLATAGCAPKFHPVMLCQPVAPGLLACVDAEQLKASDPHGH